MMRWNHGHSLATGLTVGVLAASSRVWLAVAFGAGAAVALAFVFAGRLLELVLALARRWAA